MSDEPVITMFACYGSSSAECKCRCPESCEHTWDGPFAPMLHGGSATCSRCGMLAITHDMQVVL